MSIAVTGAAGNLGRLAIEALLNRGVAANEIVAVVRNAEKASDLAERGIQIAVAPYDDEQALVAAFQGVSKLLLISGSEVGKRLAQHTAIVNAAKTAGVEFLAYTSLLNADESQLSLAVEHRATEALLAEAGIGYALLRNGWYWENFASAIDTAKATGHTFGAAGAGKIAGAARQDYAEAAAVVLTSADQAGKVYELAGQPALDSAELAVAVGEVIGSEVSYVNQSEAEYQATLEGAGLPTEVAQMLAGWETAIADGALYSDSVALTELIGRASTSAVVALGR